MLLIGEVGPLLLALCGGVCGGRIDARIPRHDLGQLPVDHLFTPIGPDPAEVIPKKYWQYVDFARVGHVALDHEVGRRGSHLRQGVVEPASDAVKT